MIKLKRPEEIRIMQSGGKILRGVVEQLVPWVRGGMTTKQVDDEATRLIRAAGADLSFAQVKGYHWATCLPVNEQIVHTIPGSRVLKDQDVLTIDIGCYYRGFHTDYATTFTIGPANPRVRRFLEAGRTALGRAIKAAARGSYLGEVSRTIEQTINHAGYAVVEELTGHGIGRELHEEPYIPGKPIGPLTKTDKICAGMALAIEVIYAEGGAAIAYEPDGWSIATADSSLSACFEKTIAVTDKNTIVLT